MTMNAWGTTAERLTDLFAWIVHAKLSHATYELFRDLAYMLPVNRLAQNLNTVLAAFTEHDLESVMSGGLRTPERMALAEIDMSDAPVAIRRTAHSLLDIEERELFIREFTGRFKDRRWRTRNVLVRRPLDN